MTKENTRRGFTLIELLVVVLIIGILAAVALPQYQKAVRKMRFSQNAVIFNTLSKAIDVYILEHGYPNERHVWFTGSFPDVYRLDIKIPWTACAGNNCSSASDAGEWAAYCSSSHCLVVLWKSSITGCPIVYQKVPSSFEWKVDITYCSLISEEQCRLVRHFFGSQHMSEILQTKCTSLGA